MTAIHFSNTDKQFSIMISDDSTIPSPESKLEGEKKMYANIRFLFSAFNEKAIPSTRIHNEIDLTHLHSILLVSSVVLNVCFSDFVRFKSSISICIHRNREQARSGFDEIVYINLSL